VALTNTRNCLAERPVCECWCILAKTWRFSRKYLPSVCFPDNRHWTRSCRPPASQQDTRRPTLSINRSDTRRLRGRPGGQPSSRRPVLLSIGPAQSSQGRAAKWEQKAAQKWASKSRSVAIKSPPSQPDTCTGRPKFSIEIKLLLLMLLLLFLESRFLNRDEIFVFPYLRADLILFPRVS